MYLNILNLIFMFVTAISTNQSTSYSCLFLYYINKGLKARHFF